MFGNFIIDKSTHISLILVLVFYAYKHVLIKCQNDGYPTSERKNGPEKFNVRQSIIG